MLSNSWVCWFLTIFLLQYCENTGNVTDHPAWRILDALECGESAADRIIGGMNAALGQFPWVVRLGYSGDETDTETDWMCGGVLVTSQHVITAAHCVEGTEDFSLQLIRVGEYDTRTNPDCQLSVCAPPVQDRKVEKVWAHERYQQPPYHNDIALIKLAQPVQTHDYVVPICLPQNEEQLVHSVVGEDITLAGWGTTNMTTGKRADILQYISWIPTKAIINRWYRLHIDKLLPVVKPELCDNFGRKFKILESEICAGAQHNKDSCGGDSGGPAIKVFDTDEGPKNVLVGVVSFGPSHCGIKKPGVYTSIPYFLDWILDHILL